MPPAPVGGMRDPQPGAIMPDPTYHILFETYNDEVDSLETQVFALVEKLNTHVYQGVGGKGRQFEDLLELSRLIDALATARLVLRAALKVHATATRRNTRQ